MREFKDLFDREINIGDTVMNIWSSSTYIPTHDYNKNYKGQGQCAPGDIQFRVAVVTRFTQHTIAIKYTLGKEEKKCNIKNTRNRILIMAKYNETTKKSDEIHADCNTCLNNSFHIDKKNDEIKRLDSINASFLIKMNKAKELIKKQKSDDKDKAEEIKSLQNHAEDLQENLRHLQRDYTRFTILDL